MGSAGYTLATRPATQQIHAWWSAGKLRAVQCVSHLETCHSMIRQIWHSDATNMTDWPHIKGCQLHKSPQVTNILSKLSHCLTSLHLLKPLHPRNSGLSLKYASMAICITKGRRATASKMLPHCSNCIFATRINVSWSKERLWHLRQATQHDWRIGLCSTSFVRTLRF